jgi:hypothetical protein
VSVSGGGGSFGRGVCSLACIMAQLMRCGCTACESSMRVVISGATLPPNGSRRENLHPRSARRRCCRSRLTHQSQTAFLIWLEMEWLDIALRVQELTTALATFNRVDQQAIRVSVTCAADGTICLSLGCSAVLAAPTAVACVTAQTLRSAISKNCLPANSPCSVDRLRQQYYLRLWSHTRQIFTRRRQKGNPDKSAPTAVAILFAIQMYPAYLTVGVFLVVESRVLQRRALLLPRRIHLSTSQLVPAQPRHNRCHGLRGPQRGVRCGQCLRRNHQQLCPAQFSRPPFPSFSANADTADNV